MYNMYVYMYVAINMYVYLCIYIAIKPASNENIF